MPAGAVAALPSSSKQGSNEDGGRKNRVLSSKQGSGEDGRGDEGGEDESDGQDDIFFVHERIPFPLGSIMA